MLLFVLYDLEKSEIQGLNELNKLENLAKTKGYKVAALTGSGKQTIEKFKKEYGFKFDFYFCDATALKTIERANPSIVLLNKGTVVQKVHYLDIADLKL